MLTVTGIYDGKTIHLLDMVNENRRFKVIVTFLEEVDESDAIFAGRPYVVNESFSFWEDSSEHLHDNHVINELPQE